MGVRGLAGWLRSHACDEANWQALTSGATVLIDGLGLVHFLVRHRCATPLSSYAALHASIASFLSELTEAGLTPAVYLDGRASRLKAATISSRRQQRADALEALQAACLDGRRITNASLPEPPMLVEQLAASVAAAGVRIVRCAGEADVDLARACAALNGAFGSGTAYVLGDDSDFLLHAGVEYVNVQELTVERSGEASVVAMTYCNFNTLSKSSFDTIRKKHPEYGRALDKATIQQITMSPVKEQKVLS